MLPPVPRRAVAFSLSLLAATAAASPAADPPAKVAPAALAGQWRLVVWQDEFYGTGLSVFTLAIRDGKVVLVPAKGGAESWGRSVGDLEHADGVLRFKVTFETRSDDTETKPLKEEWFEGRLDPKTPGRVCGVLAPKGPAGAENADRLRPAEMTPAPAAKPDDFAWAMPSVITPGTSALQGELNEPRTKLLQGKELTPAERFSAAGHFAILDEFAAARKPDRRGFHMLCMLVRNAHLATGVATPERVEGWLVELLRYAAPYGPRYATQLRSGLARELEQGKEDAYKSIVARLKAAGEFAPEKPSAKK